MGTARDLLVSAGVPGGGPRGGAACKSGQLVPSGPPLPEGVSNSLCDWRRFEPGAAFRALAVVERDETGGFVSHSPSLPGAVSQGETVGEALRNLKEPIAGCIEAPFAGWVDVDV